MLHTVHCENLKNFSNVYNANCKKKGKWNTIFVTISSGRVGDDQECRAESFEKSDKWPGQAGWEPTRSSEFVCSV